jgi:hypothetical protein
MRGLALAEIAAVDLDICCLWLVAAPELPFGDQLKRFVAGRMPQRREDRGKVSNIGSVASKRGVSSGRRHALCCSLSSTAAQSRYRRQTEGHNTCAARSP